MTMGTGLPMKVQGIYIFTDTAGECLWFKNHCLQTGNLHLTDQVDHECVRFIWFLTSAHNCCIPVSWNKLCFCRNVMYFTGPIE